MGHIAVLVLFALFLSSCVTVQPAAPRTDVDATRTQDAANFKLTIEAITRAAPQSVRATSPTDAPPTNTPRPTYTQAPTTTPRKATSTPRWTPIPGRRADQDIANDIDKHIVVGGVDPIDVQLWDTDGLRVLFVHIDAEGKDWVDPRILDQLKTIQLEVIASQLYDAQLDDMFIAIDNAPVEPAYIAIGLDPAVLWYRKLITGRDYFTFW